MDVPRSGTRICFLSHSRPSRIAILEAAAKLETRSAFVCGVSVHSHNDVNTLRNKVQAGRAIAREKTREMMPDAQSLSHMQTSPPFNTAVIYLL
jgi:hypothetical protein